MVSEEGARKAHRFEITTSPLKVRIRRAALPSPNVAVIDRRPTPRARPPWRRLASPPRISGRSDRIAPLNVFAVKSNHGASGSLSRTLPEWEVKS
jgi:hypothetical protein